MIDIARSARQVLAYFTSKASSYLWWSEPQQPTPAQSNNKHDDVLLYTVYVFDCICMFCVWNKQKQVLLSFRPFSSKFLLSSTYRFAGVHSGHISRSRQLTQKCLSKAFWHSYKCYTCCKLALSAVTGHLGLGIASLFLQSTQRPHITISQQFMASCSRIQTMCRRHGARWLLSIH